MTGWVIWSILVLAETAVIVGLATMLIWPWTYVSDLPEPGDVSFTLVNALSAVVPVLLTGGLAWLLRHHQRSKWAVPGVLLPVAVLCVTVGAMAVRADN